MFDSIENLYSDPRMGEARAFLASMHNKGLSVYSHPRNGALLVSACAKGKATPIQGKDLDAMKDLAHEISVVQAVETLFKHYQSLSAARGALLRASTKPEVKSNAS